MQVIHACVEVFPMWDEQKRQRFQELRQRDGLLSETERAELALLVQELETGEVAYLAPATKRLREERETLDGQNRAMQALALRKEALVLRLRDFVAEAEAESRAIEGELAAVLAGNRESEADG